MKAIYRIGLNIFLLFSIIVAQGQQLSETHNFKTYDTTISYTSNPNVKFSLRISRPVDLFTPNNADTASRPAIITMPGSGEVGTDTSYLTKYGPHYWLKNGWDGGVLLGNGVHYPILITICQGVALTVPYDMEPLMDYLITAYHLKKGSIHVAGLAEGSAIWGDYICYSPSSGDQHCMSLIKSYTALSGQGNANDNPSIGSNYSGYSAYNIWAQKYGGKYFGIQGASDLQHTNTPRDSMNKAKAGSAYFASTSDGGGGHCCWNDEYNPATHDWTSVAPITNSNITATSIPNSMGSYTAGSSIFQWMLRQGDTTLTGSPVPTIVLYPVPGKIEAEGYAYFSGINTQPTTDAGGGANVGWIDQGDWMQYKVNVATTGTYLVSFRVATPNANAGFQVKNVNGSVLATVNVPNTGGYQTWQTITATVNLTAGVQLLQIYSTSTTEWNFNWMQFATLPVAPIPGKIEAENFNTMFGVVTQTTTDTGAGMNAEMIGGGAATNYQVNVAAAGAYLVSFRIATTNQNIYFQLRQSDGTVLTTVHINPTGGLQTWQTVTATVQLPAGAQTLQLYSVTSPQWNINWIQFAALTAAAIPGKIEAENYTNTSGTQVEVTSDAGGGMDVGYFNQGDWMDYNVNVASAGTYTITSRIATNHVGCGFQLKQANGTVLATVTFPNTGGFTNWQTVSATVTLPAGNQTLRIYSNTTYGWSFNWVDFQTSSAVVSESEVTTAVTLPGTVQAENYSSMSGVQTQTTSDAGGGLNVAYIDQSDWMNYKVNVTSAGTYTASFRVASVSDGGRFELRSATGSVLATIPIPNTSGFQTWQTVTATVTLPAGNQTLQLNSTGAVSWNINWFQVSAISAAAIPGKIEAENYVAMAGVQTQITTDAGGGLNVGYIDQGDWINYNTNVASAGAYTVSFRVACASAGAKFELRLLGGGVLAALNVPNTGGYQTWQTVIATVTLAAGNQTLQVNSTGATSWNINWMQFTSGATVTVAAVTQSRSVVVAADAVQPDSSAAIPSEEVASSFTLYPNPARDHFTLEINNAHTGPMNTQVISLSGAIVRTYASQKDGQSARLDVPCDGLTPGVYIVRVQIGSQWTIVKKVLKQ